MSQPSLTLHHPAATVTPSGAFAGARRFLLHLAAMVALMYAGMIALDPFYGWAARQLGSTNPATDWPAVSAIVMTAEMTLPMIPFMRWHGHTLRHIVEMAGAMAAPAVVAGGLHLAGAIPADSVMGIGHLAMIPAMLAAMLYRRSDYTAPASAVVSTGGIANVPDTVPVTQPTRRHARAFALAASSTSQLASRARAGMDMRHLR
jgi:flagellar biosynthetic protein FliP